MNSDESNRYGWPNRIVLTQGTVACTLNLEQIQKCTTEGGALLHVNYITEKASLILIFIANTSLMYIFLESLNKM